MKRLLSLIVFISMLSCSSDDDVISKNSLLGVWEKTSRINSDDYAELNEDESYEFVVQYKFMNNNDFESYSFLRNAEDSSIVGYSFQEKGTYSINENRLTLISDRWITNSETGQFTAIENLIINEEEVEWSFNISINKMDTLTFDFDPCGPTQNCVGSLALFRVK